MASQGAPKAGEAEGMPGKSDERKGPAQKGHGARAGGCMP